MVEKWKFILLLPIFIICGCGKNIILNINQNDITNIIYDGVNISNNDFDSITEKINNKNFYELGNIDINGKKLTIKTLEYSYDLEIFKNFILYTVDNSKYYIKDIEIDNFFKKMVDKYEKEEFYKINMVENYDINDSDYLIKLSDNNSYIIFKPLVNIYDFEINNTNYVSKIQNKINMVENNKIICIQIDNLDNLNINFRNPYNYKVNITYNNMFITKIKKIDE